MTGIKVLRSDFMERWFATSNWVMPGLWFVPIVVLGLWYSMAHMGLSVLATAAFYVVGVFAWSFVEYWLHRVAFHLPPFKNHFVRQVQFVLHGYHHEFPNDTGRLVAPPALSWPIAALLAGVYMAAFGSAWPALYAGTCTGYLAYDWMHYYTHHATPRTPMGRFMRRFHFEHHFKDAKTQYGLSSPLWDVLFGSFRKPDEGAVSYEDPEARHRAA